MRREEFLRRCAAYLAGAGIYCSPLTSLASISEDHQDFAKQQFFERAQPMMGSFVRVGIYHSNARKAHALMTRCFFHMAKVANKLSPFESFSDTTLLNSRRRLSVEILSDDFLKILRVAKELDQRTNRSFSLFAGGLSNLWKQSRVTNKFPSPKRIDEELKKLDDSFLLINRNSIELSESGKLEVCGIAKGFVADAGVKFLKKSGVLSGRIDCGGDLRFFGNDSKWIVGLESPRGNNQLALSFKVSANSGVATSGDYRENWMVQGHQCHHLIDCQTGYPSREMHSATVIADTACRADALATGIFSMSIANALQFAAQEVEMEVILIDNAGDIHCSAGVKVS